MRADRLLSILLLLQTRGRMTAWELAEQLEVSERTIYRDIEALGIAGIPVYAERGPGGGCSLLDGYQTRLTGLNESEIRALFLLKMAGPLADLGLSKALDDALLKLQASLPAPQRHDAEQVRQRIHLDAGGPDDRNGHHSISSHLQTIQEAVWQDRKLVLMYSTRPPDTREGCHSISGEGEGQQIVEPYGLVSQANTWYLVGAVSGQKQVFCVTHIQSVTITAEQFARPENFDLPLYWSEYRTQVKEKNGFKPLPTRRQSPLIHQKKASPMAGRLLTQQKKRISNPRPQQPQQKKSYRISSFASNTTKKRNFPCPVMATTRKKKLY